MHSLRRRRSDIAECCRYAGVAGVVVGRLGKRSLVLARENTSEWLRRASGWMLGAKRGKMATEMTVTWEISLANLCNLFNVRKQANIQHSLPNGDSKLFNTLSKLH